MDQALIHSTQMLILNTQNQLATGYQIVMSTEYLLSRVSRKKKKNRGKKEKKRARFISTHLCLTASFSTAGFPFVLLLLK